MMTWACRAVNNTPSWRRLLLLGLMAASLSWTPSSAFVVRQQQQGFGSPFGLTRSSNVIQPVDNRRALVILESSNHKRKKDQGGKKDLGFGSGFAKSSSSSSSPGGKSKKSDASSSNDRTGASGDAADGISKKQFFYADTELSANASGAADDAPSVDNDEVPTEGSSDDSTEAEADTAAAPLEVEASTPEAEATAKDEPIAEPITAKKEEQEESPPLPPPPVVEPEAPPPAAPMPDYIKLEAENDPRRAGGGGGRQVNVGASAATRGTQSIRAGSTSSMNEPPQPIDRAPYQPSGGGGGGGITGSSEPPMMTAPSGGGYGGDAGEVPVDPETEMYIEALEAKMKILDEKMKIIAEVSQSIPTDEPPPPPPSQYAEGPGAQPTSLPVDRSDLFSPGSRYPPRRSSSPADLAVDSPSFLSGDSFITGGMSPAVKAGNRAVTRTTPPTAPGTGMSNSMASIPVDREDLFLPGSPHPDRYLPGAPKFPTSNNPNLRGQQPQYAQQPFLQENLPQQQTPPPPPPPPARMAPPPPPENAGATSASSPPPPRVETTMATPPPPPRDALLPDRSDIFLPRSRNDVYLPGSPVTASGSGSGPGSSQLGPEDRPAALSVDRQDAFLPARPGMNYPQSPLPQQSGGSSPEGRPPALSVDRQDAFEPARPGMYYPQGPSGAAAAASRSGGGGPPPEDRPETLSMDRSDVFLPAPTHSSSRSRTATSLASDLVNKLRLDVDAPGQGFSNGDAFASGVPGRDNRVPASGGYDMDDPASMPQSLAVDRPDVYRPAAPHGANVKPSLTSQQLSRIRSLPEDTPRAFNPGPDWKK